MTSASKIFLPDWFAVVITLSALLAAATSANVALITASRSFFALARHKIYPEILNHLNSRTNEPVVALILVGLLTMGGIALKGNIIQYASANVIGLMFYGIVWSIGLIRLPKVLPKLYANAEFKLNIPTIWVAAIIKIMISVGFLYVGIVNNLGPAGIYATLIMIGAAYYFIRENHLSNKGISLKQILRNEADQDF